MSARQTTAGRAGYSDGFHGYRCDPGDWIDSEGNAYRSAWREGRAARASGAAWGWVQKMHPSPGGKL
ncbi:MAG: hypothetical protein ACRYG4_04070 [Janthinobacterium lividum]